MTTYTGYISKSYFPKELWPKGNGIEFTDEFEVFKIRAESRTKAAKSWWDKNKKRLSPLMTLYVSKSGLKRKISININDPKAAGRQTSTRIAPILVEWH
jgi:hypothetical protein